MGFLLLDVLEDTLTHSSEGIASIQDMENDVGGVYNLIQFTIDSSRGTFEIDRFDVVGVCLRHNFFRLDRFCTFYKT